MSLVTRCPKCQSAFEVSADLLKLHDGLVRCGHCSHVFDGLAHLQATLPTLTRKVDATAAPGVAPSAAAVATAATLEPAPQVFRTPSRAPLTRHAGDEPRLTAAAQPIAVSPVAAVAPSVFRSPARGLEAHAIEPTWPAQDPDEPTLGVPLARPAPESAGPVRILGETRLRGEDPSSFGRSLPDFMEDEVPPAPWVRPLWALGCLLLLVVLLAQLLYVFRNDVASASPGLRGALTQLCKPLGCEVAYPRRIERVFIVGASLQQASAAAASGNEFRYQLRFTLQNRFDQDQQWPSLMVQLSDSSGTAVIRKAIAPSQYLPAEWVGQPFKARQELSLDMPMTVTGAPISGFELTKFFP